MKKLVLTCGIRRECRAQWTMKGLITLKSKNSFLWKVFRQRLDLTQHPWWSGLHFTARQLCVELHLPIQCHSGGFNCQSIYRQSKMRSHAQFKASHVRQWSGWTESNWQQNEVREKADEWKAGGVTGRGGEECILFQTILIKTNNISDCNWPVVRWCDLILSCECCLFVLYPYCFIAIKRSSLVLLAKCTWSTEHQQAWLTQ